MLLRSIWYFIFSVIVVISNSLCMIYDNRFWPIYPQRFFAYQPYPSSEWYFSARGLLIGANNSFLENDDEVDLFNVFGVYDDRAIAAAAQKAGLIMDLDLQTDLFMIGALQWKQPGKMSTRGVAFETDISLGDYISIGGSLYVGEIHAYMQHIFVNPDVQLLPGDLAEIRALHYKLLEKLSFHSLCESSAVFGDTDMYIRGRITADYWMKIHHLDIGVRCGVWMPSGTRGSLKNPISFPIGGNGHWGFYVQLDTLLLLNDCISAGFSLNISKRLTKTGMHRLPLDQEPLSYGALLACATVSPGSTVAWNPYVQFGGIREGLGLMAGYFLIYHAQDLWCIADDVQKQFSPNLSLLVDQSSWGSDHFSVAAYYDFGFEKLDSYSAPIISMTVDIPWKGPVTKRVPKSHAISLRIESRI